MVTRTRLNVTLYVNCLSCQFTTMLYSGAIRVFILLYYVMGCRCVYIYIIFPGSVDSDLVGTEPRRNSGRGHILSRFASTWYGVSWHSYSETGADTVKSYNKVLIWFCQRINKQNRENLVSTGDRKFGFKPRISGMRVARVRQLLKLVMVISIRPLTVYGSHIQPAIQKKQQTLGGTFRGRNQNVKTIIPLKTKINLHFKQWFSSYLTEKMVSCD
jgi:hypothetical protein